MGTYSISYGYGGNIIYVNKDKNIVVGIASLFAHNVTDRIEFIQEYIESMFNKDE